MNELTIINTPMFNDETYDVYSDGNRIFMTRLQIGQALGYENPQKAIDNIHAKHSNRLEPLSVTLKVRGTDGKMYNTYLYNQRGIMEICRWSRQPIADKFMDWVWDIIEAYRDGSLIPYSANVPIISLTQKQIETMIDDKLMHFKQEELSHLAQEYLSRFTHEYLSLNASSADVHSTAPIQTIVQSPMDVIRTTIEPLAKALNDNSKGYNCTFRKVYATMNVSWKNRLSRYQHQHNNKNKPSKLRLIADNPKLLKLFVNTVNELMASIE